MANVIQIIVEGKDEASKVLGGIGSAVSGLGKVAIGAGAIAGAAAVGIGAAFTKLAIDAAPLADIKTSFEGITKASGTTAAAILADFKENTAGMLSNADAMASYNEAAQLITPTFANQLPGAMEYLSKISASTSEDLDYLVDSLVKGVGRESVAILDNLKIQVDREEAIKKGATALGISVEEMTKAQRQEALMAEVMKKLAENTAALPDVTESANAKMKAMRATLVDVKDSIGLALQPALIAVLSPLGDLAEKYGPQVTEWAGKAGEWLGVKLPLAVDWLGEKWGILWPIVSEGLSTAWGIAGPIFDAISDFFSNEGPGALTSFQGIWGDKFGWIAEWVKENLPLIRETITVVMTRIKEVVGFVLSTIKDFWDKHGTAIMSIVGSVFNILWAIFDVGLRNIFDVVKLVMQLITGDWSGAGETLKGIASRTWEGIKTIFSNGINIAKNLLSIGLKEAIAMAEGLKWRLVDAGRKLMDGLKEGVAKGMTAVKDAIVNAVKEAIRKAKEALGIGSPSKVFANIGQFAMQGLAVGITEAASLPATAAERAVRNMYTTTNNYLTMNVQTQATTPTVVGGFETMRALV